LNIGGLTNGETVLIQKFLDANRSGVIDGGDILWQQFRLTDGKASVFYDGATPVTNLNAVGDLDSTAGQITARFNLPASGFEQTIVGNYLWKLSSPFGNFAPLTNAFTITNFPFGQSFSGSVVANGTNVPNAAVLLFQPAGHDMNPVGGTVADNSGNYVLSAAPGNYLLVAFKSNFVANLDATPVLTLGSGANLSTNVILSSADRSVSGAVINASNLMGVGGLLLPIESQNGLLTLAFTDTDGNFNAGVTSGQWKIDSQDEAMSFHDFVRPQGKVQVDVTTGSVAGVTIALSKANALFYGSVKDAQNQPLAGIQLFSQDNNNQFEESASSDVGGKYFAGALSGTAWRMEISNNGNPSNYNFSGPSFDFNQNGGTNLNAGQALLVNFTALLATNQITGHVQDSNGAPIVNVQLFAGATIGGVNFQASANTDNSGNYSMNVANGNWSVGVICQGGDNSLDSILGNGNYLCPNNQSVTISNSNGTANFSIQPCGGIQISTASPLPNAVLGSFYSIQFFASSCAGNINWSLNSGSVPTGLFLSNGVLNGTPTATGTFNFSLHLSDGVSSTNQSYSLTVNPPPAPPTLGQPAKSGSQFQFRVSGYSGLTYTVQTSTNLGSTNWSSILVTNPPGSSFLVIDPNATSPARFYRVLLGP